MLCHKDGRLMDRVLLYHESCHTVGKALQQKESRQVKKGVRNIEIELVGG